MRYHIFSWFASIKALSRWTIEAIHEKIRCWSLDEHLLWLSAACPKVDQEQYCVFFFYFLLLFIACLLQVRLWANTVWKYLNTNMNTSHIYECEYKCIHFSKYLNTNANTLGSIHECIYEYKRLINQHFMPFCNIY